MSSVPQVNVGAVSKESKVLDVREDYEWEAGHIGGAAHIPLDQLMARYGEIDPDEEVVVVCRSGGRSQRATEWLNGNGFEAVNLTGGMGAWMDANLPMVSENGDAPYVK